MDGRLMTDWHRTFNAIYENESRWALGDQTDGTPRTETYVPILGHDEYRKVDICKSKKLYK